MELATPDLDLIKQAEQGARDRRGRSPRAAPVILPTGPEALVPLSALGRGPRGLPVNGGDKRLEADSADDLFEGAVVAVGRDEEGADRDLRGVFEI